MTLYGWPLVDVSISLLSVKDQNVVRCNDKIFLSTADFDAVKTFLAVDNVEGFSWTSVGSEEKVTFLDIFNVDLRAVVEGQSSSFGETGL